MSGGSNTLTMRPNALGPTRGRSAAKGESDAARPRHSAMGKQPDKP